MHFDTMIHDGQIAAADHAAGTFGCNRKERIAPGMNADIAIRNPGARITPCAENQHSNKDYFPFEGMQLTGQPETVMSRGVVTARNGKLRVEPGQGPFFARLSADLRGKPGDPVKEMDRPHASGADPRS